MKLLSLLPLTMIFVVHANCQNTYIHSDGKIYVGLSNNIAVCTEKDVDSVFVLVDNGSVTQTSKFEFTWYPFVSGRIKVSAYCVKGADTAFCASKYFDVFELIPQAFIIGSENKAISKDSLMRTKGLFYRFPNNANLCGNMKIVSFSIIILRKGEVIYLGRNETNVINNATGEMLSKVEKSDIIVFYEILFKMGEHIHILDPLELHVK